MGQFETADASAYERVRPGYPNDVLELFDITSGASVLEVGAGTGRMTELLVHMGYSVTAVEPHPDMARLLAERISGVDIHDAHADHLPFANGSFEGIVVAQALHWFSNRKTSRELKRVLRKDGRLAVIWNRGDTTPRWLTRVSTPVPRPRHHQIPSDRHLAALTRRDFELVLRRSIRFEHYVQKEDLPVLLAQASRAGSKVHDTECSVSRLVEREPELAGKSSVLLPLVCEVAMVAPRAASHGGLIWRR